MQPYLQVELAGSDVKLSWVTFGSTCAPQFTGDLGGASWQPVPGTPTMVNGRYTQTPATTPP